MDRATQWFEYDWPIEGRGARFAVDMSFSGTPCQGYAALMYLSCSSRRAGAEKLSALEGMRAAALLKKVQKKFLFLYVGYIETGAQRQYYFYGRSMKEQKELIRLAADEKLLLCCAGAAEEEDWATYRLLLYPDKAKLQTEWNRDHIERMVKNGDAPGNVRRVTLNMFFPTEPIMLLFSEQARLSGFALAGNLYEPEYDLAYGVGLIKLSTLDKAEIDAMTTRAIRIADDYGGELRSWEAPIIKRGGPLM